MIIVQLKGGLGNQLFQYAAGKQLSVKHNAPLKFDLSFLNAEPTSYTKRSLELDKLHINFEIASEKEIKTIKGQRWKNIFIPTWIKERGGGCYSQFNRAGKNCYLDGYFQSETYFVNAAEQIRNELTFRNSLTEAKWADIKEQITNSNSISLHFRRGDYIENQKANQYHGVCSMDYYHKAVKEIAEQTENPLFFVFSDDIRWVIDNFSINFPTVFVEEKDEIAHSDFQLMSLCKHNIIANSSYSWWAAWLNKNEHKIVIAPEKWYANSEMQEKTTNLLPQNWIKL
ncbi:MAG: alpha-1,2-fucosyltransferase [Bacteroidales bacterium]|nr:alpha-1,2-fucosyltransferase [Bacteroidales bacterium]